MYRVNCVNDSHLTKFNQCFERSKCSVLTRTGEPTSTFALQTLRCFPPDTGLVHYDKASEKKFQDQRLTVRKLRLSA